MFGLKSGKCKTALKQALSDCFDPLKDELGTVPVVLHSNKYVTASILGICEGYAQTNNISRQQTIAIITDAVFEEIFRRESTSILKQVDLWINDNDAEFISQYEDAKSKSSTNELNTEWLKNYLTANFEPSRNLML